MPFYSYQCVDCGAPEPRLAGIDDHTALCVKCGGLMLRMDEDIFAPLFEEQRLLAPIWEQFHDGLAQAKAELEKTP